MTPYSVALRKVRLSKLPERFGVRVSGIRRPKAAGDSAQLCPARLLSLPT